MKTKSTATHNPASRLLSKARNATKVRGRIPALLGIPFDGQSSFLRGAAEAPSKIREALACDSSNHWTETGVDLGAAGIYEDAGDLRFSGKDEDVVSEI